MTHTMKESAPYKHNGRYMYASTKTLEQAKARLEDFYATGEVSEAEQPLIESAPFGYVITILETGE